MNEKVHKYLDNLGYVFLWIGFWSLSDIYIEKYLKKYKILIYLLFIAIGTLMMFLI